jgi:hypothetical protein
VLGPTAIGEHAVIRAASVGRLSPAALTMAAVLAANRREGGQGVRHAEGEDGQDGQQAQAC